MLVFTRRVGEKLILENEDEITAVVLDVRGSKVKLGIDAPKHIKVQRADATDTEKKVAVEATAE